MIFNLVLSNAMQTEEDIFNSPSIYNNYTATVLNWLPSVSLRECTFHNCVQITSFAFSGNNTMVSINFPKCSSIPYQCFQSHTRLQTIKFSACKYIGALAFFGCTNLTSVDIPNVEDIADWAFSKCEELSSLSVPNCSYMGSTALKSTIIKNLCYGIQYDSDSQRLYRLTSNIASTLTNVELPSCTNLNTYAFSNCQQLQYISIPVCSEIGAGAFSNC